MKMPANLTTPRQWPAMWEAYWFAPSAGVRLSVMRIIVVALQLTYFRRPLEAHLNLLASNDHFHHPQILIRLIASVVPVDAFRSDATFTTMYAIMMIAGVMAIVGLLTRPAVFIFGFLNLLFISHGYSYGEEHHPEALFALFILLLAFAPCNIALSLDALIGQRASAKRGDAGARWGRSAISTQTRWPILLTQWLLVIAYFYAGLAKVKRGGPDWFNGTTLQTYLLMDSIRWDRPVGLWMAQHKTLCIISSYGAVGLELFFWVAVVFKRIAPLFLIAGAMMHIGIYVMQAAPFWQFLVLYLLWVPWERVPGLRSVDA